MLNFIGDLNSKMLLRHSKVKLTSAPVLILPDYTREFILCTDGSDIGLGGILMQERNGKPQPIAYASRLCTSA